MIAGLPSTGFYARMHDTYFINPKNKIDKTQSISLALQILHIWRWRA